MNFKLVVLSLHFTFLMIVNPILAVDTLKLDLPAVEKVFLQENLLLIAQKYGVAYNQALVIQSKLYPNPMISTELPIYNPNQGRMFDVGSNGQKIFGFEQLIITAGKRRINIDMTKEQAKFSEYEFYEVLRALKFELRSSFYQLYFNGEKLLKYQEQQETIKSLITAFQSQFQRGNVAQKEVLRLQAIYLELSNRMIAVKKEHNENQRSLQTLLGTSLIIIPEIKDEYQGYKYKDGMSELSLIDSAINHRYDIKQSQSNLKMAELNYSYQKRSRIPNLNIGAIYDQTGNYIPNYTALTVAVDLPVWNRNTGNIRAAKYYTDETEVLLQNTMNKVQSEVYSAYSNVKYIDGEYQKMEYNFDDQFERVNETVKENFKKRNISLLEFTDFFESYNQVINSFYELRLARFTAFEELNYVLGMDYFKI